MKISKITILFLTLLLMAAPLLSIPTTPAEANPVYYTVEPVAISPLTNINSSINGLETPPTPSPIGQNFTVEIHLVGATADNVPAGVEGVEIHFYFGNILTYAVPTGFTSMLGQPGGVLTGPSSQLLSAITAGFYDASGKVVSSPPYTGAVYYKVASASMAGGWNGADDLMANVTFEVIKQPQSGNGETTVNLPLACDFTDVTDANAVDVTHDTIQGTLTIDATPAVSQQNYALRVNTVGNGTVTENPFNATYASGFNVTLTAVPSVGWAFEGWSGDVTGTQNPVSVTMNGNKTVTATFTQPGVYYNLTVNVVGNGTVTKSPFNATYLSGTFVTLTAVPAFNWTFAGWTGDLVSSQNPANITMTANKNVTAQFTQLASAAYTLTVSVIGNGTVAENPSNGTYASGSTVSLTAVSGVGWTFQGWTGDITSVQNPVSVTMNGNKTVTATFVQVSLPSYTLTLNVVGKGTVTENPFSTTYLGGTIASLTAVPGAGWTFQSWTGDVIGGQNPVNITMNGNKTVTATFTQFAQYYSLKVNVVGNGTVTESPLSATYASGSNVTLTAVPALNWVFGGWSGDVTGTQNPVGIAINGNKTVTATFTQPGVHYNLTVNVIGKGTVTQNPLNTTYLSGTHVTLTAIPAANWTFQGWGGDVTGTQNPATVTMDTNKSVTATFTQVVPIQVHDVAITSVEISPSQVHMGEFVQIVVEAANLGDYSETFDVTVYHSPSIIQVIPVNSLSPHTSKTLTVEWNTANVSTGVYTVGASATVVEGDVNPANNNFTDGKVTILPIVAPAYFVSGLLLFVGFIGLDALAGSVSLVMLMVAYAAKRRRRKTVARGHRYAVIVHRHV